MNWRSHCSRASGRVAAAIAGLLGVCNVLMTVGRRELVVLRNPPWQKTEFGLVGRRSPRICDCDGAAMADFVDDRAAADKEEEKVEAANPEEEEDDGLPPDEEEASEGSDDESGSDSDDSSEEGGSDEVRCGSPAPSPPSQTQQGSVKRRQWGDAAANAP